MPNPYTLLLAAGLDCQGGCPAGAGPDGAAAGGTRPLAGRPGGCDKRAPTGCVCMQWSTPLSSGCQVAACRAPAHAVAGPHGPLPRPPHLFCPAAASPPLPAATASAPGTAGPSTPSPPAGGSADSYAGVTFTLAGYDVTHCLPAIFFTLIRSAANFTTSALPSTDGLDIATNCSAVPGPDGANVTWLVVNYLLHDKVYLGSAEAAQAAAAQAPAGKPSSPLPAAAGPAAAAPAPAAGSQRAPSPAPSPADDGAAAALALDNLWLAVQRQLAITVADYISSPIGPMWAVSPAYTVRPAA